MAKSLDIIKRPHRRKTFMSHTLSRFVWNTIKNNFQSGLSTIGLVSLLVMLVAPVSVGAVMRPVTADDDLLGDMLDGRS